MENEEIKTENVSPENLVIDTDQKAISVLIQIAHLAQRQGILSLKDATIAFNAISFFSEKEMNVNQENKP